MRTIKLTLLLCLIIGMSTIAQDLQYNWSFSSGYWNNEIGHSVAIDDQGNIYASGQYSGTLDFDPGPGVFELTSTTGGYDIYIIKLTASGDFCWAKTIGGTTFDSDIVHAMTCLNGKLFLTGQYSGAVDFNPGLGDSIITSISNVTDIFVLKLDTAGNFIWAQSMGGSNYDYAHAISVDAMENVYITGFFRTTCDFDPGPGTYYISSEGMNDVFTLKLNASGSLAWVNTMGQTTNDRGYAIGLDSLGNVYAAGVFANTLDIDPDTSVQLISTNGIEDVYLVKYDNNGDFIWGNGIGGVLHDYAYGMSVNAGGEIFLTGYFEDTTDFDPDTSSALLVANGGADLFVAKYETTGALAWAKRVGGVGTDKGVDVKLDTEENIYVHGNFSGLVDFDPGPNIHEATYYGSNDIFVLILDSQGDFIRAKTIGGPGSEEAQNMALGIDGSVALTGGFEYTADFDPNLNYESHTVVGQYDIFLVSLVQPNALDAAFAATDSSFALGTSILFSDLSEGLPEKWHWDFGDGTSDSIQNPWHSYQAAGIYTVTLIVEKDQQIDTLVIDSFIEVHLNLELSIDTTHVICYGGNNGAIDITVLNGSTPLTYIWGHGSTNEDLENLVAGIYEVTIMDPLMVSFQGSIEISQPSEIQISESIINDYCSTSIGEIDISIQGGIPPYAYVWSNFATVQDISTLSGGTYNLTAFDSNNCLVSESYEVVGPAVPLSITLSANHASCYQFLDGSIDAVVLGGLPETYSILWSTGDTSQSLENLGAGIYEITILSDSFQCTATNSIEVSQPLALTITPTITDNVCDGAIDLSIAGGTFPYNYSWSNGATTQHLSEIAAGMYTLTIIDDHNCLLVDSFELIHAASPLAIELIPTDVTCFPLNDGSIAVNIIGGAQDSILYNWSNGTTADSLSGLAAGNYSLSITQSNFLCTAEATVDLTASMQATHTPVITDVTCFGGNNGSIHINSTGGNEPYSYYWSLGMTADTIENLYAGVYIVSITDSIGCHDTLLIDLVQQDELVTSITSENIACYGLNTGRVLAGVSGGEAPYRFAWSSGDTTSLIDNLVAGTYELTVTDSLGCTDSSMVFLSEPDPLEVFALISHALVNDTSAGAIQTILSGGTPPYEFVWSTGATSQSLSNLVAGNYDLTIIDANDCLWDSTFLVAILNDINETEAVQNNFVLHQNWPNPFAHHTTISYYLPQNTQVSFEVHDVTGAIIESVMLGEKSMGLNNFIFNRKNKAPGTYYYTLSTEHVRQTKKLIILNQ